MVRLLSNFLYSVFLIFLFSFKWTNYKVWLPIKDCVTRINALPISFMHPHGFKPRTTALPRNVHVSAWGESNYKTQFQGIIWKQTRHIHTKKHNLSLWLPNNPFTMSLTIRPFLHCNMPPPDPNNSAVYIAFHVLKVILPLFYWEVWQMKFTTTTGKLIFDSE